MTVDVSTWGVCCSCCSCCSCCCFRCWFACSFSISRVGIWIKTCWYSGNCITPLTNVAPWNGFTTLTETSVDVWSSVSNWTLDWFVAKLDSIDVIDELIVVSSSTIVLISVRALWIDFCLLVLVTGVDIWLGWNELSRSDWDRLKSMLLSLLLSSGLLSLRLDFCLGRNSSGSSYLFICRSMVRIETLETFPQNLPHQSQHRLDWKTIRRPNRSVLFWKCWLRAALLCRLKISSNTKAISETIPFVG